MSMPSVTSTHHVCACICHHKYRLLQRYCTSSQQHVEVWQMSDNLHWLDITDRAKYRLCATSTNVSTPPQYLSDLCTPVAEVPLCQSLCSASYGQLHTPRYYRPTNVRRMFIRLHCAILMNLYHMHSKTLPCHWLLSEAVENFSAYWHCHIKRIRSRSMTMCCTDFHLSLSFVFVYLSFDSMVELWFEIMQIRCLALKAHSGIMWPSVEMFAHPWTRVKDNWAWCNRF